jgi:hypothetical protein
MLYVLNLLSALSPNKQLQKLKVKVAYTTFPWPLLSPNLEELDLSSNFLGFDDPQINSSTKLKSFRYMSTFRSSSSCKTWLKNVQDLKSISFSDTQLIDNWLFLNQRKKTIEKLVLERPTRLENIKSFLEFNDNIRWFGYNYVGASFQDIYMYVKTTSLQTLELSFSGLLQHFPHLNYYLSETGTLKTLILYSTFQDAWTFTRKLQLYYAWTLEEIIFKFKFESGVKVTDLLQLLRIIRNQKGSQFKVNGFKVGDAIKELNKNAVLKTAKFSKFEPWHTDTRFFIV